MCAMMHHKLLQQKMYMTEVNGHWLGIYRAEWMRWGKLTKATTTKPGRQKGGTLFDTGTIFRKMRGQSFEGFVCKKVQPALGVVV